MRDSVSRIIRVLSVICLILDSGDASVSFSSIFTAYCHVFMHLCNLHAAFSFDNAMCSTLPDAITNSFIFHVYFMTLNIAS